MPQWNRKAVGRRSESSGLNVGSEQAECQMDAKDSCNESVEFLWKQEYN